MMNPRIRGKRACVAVIVGAAKTHRRALAIAALGAFAAFGCHTWQGVKEDTHNAVQGTGRGLKKAGEKLEGSDEKNQKPASPPANEGDAGAPSHR
jgi:hypothetical protein